MSIFNQIPHITSRIETATSSGGSIGTGFFFNIPVPERGTMTVLVTNKHVVDGAHTARIHMTRATGTEPMFGAINSWTITDFQQNVVRHPDALVDLAAFPVGGILNQMQASGTPAYFRALDESHIPSQDQISTLTAVENILMVGYPTGIWDQSNNLPIIRRGITATPFSLNYDDRPEFMIDCACFPGSSGSPILIADEGSYATTTGIVLGSRFHFLGLLWGGPQYTTEGAIVARPVPTSVTPVAVSQIPTNLGFCVKSRMVSDLIPLLLQRFG